MKVSFPSFKHEKKLWKKGYHVIGVDEVGRGSLAGPVVVSAVCFPSTILKEEVAELEKAGINDSKQLKHTARVLIARLIKKRACCFATSATSVSHINKYGITKATNKAIRHAIAEVRKKGNCAKSFILLDAFYVKHIKGIGLINQKAIVKGDQIAISIAAASIVAKVERDALMRSLSRRYPPYLWGQNKGYGTRKHQIAIMKYGKTKLHRDLYLRTLFAKQTLSAIG